MSPKRYTPSVVRNRLLSLANQHAREAGWYENGSPPWIKPDGRIAAVQREREALFRAAAEMVGALVRKRKTAPISHDCLTRGV